MSIRKFAKNDIDKWVELAEQDFLPEDFCSHKWFDENLDFVDGWISQDENNDWLGVFLLSRKPHSFDPNGIHFVQVWVAPQHRGQGISKKLVQIGLENSVGSIKSVCINPGNTASINLFTGFGFTKQHPHKTWDVYLLK